MPGTEGFRSQEDRADPSSWLHPEERSGHSEVPEGEWRRGRRGPMWLLFALYFDAKAPGVVALHTVARQYATKPGQCHLTERRCHLGRQQLRLKEFLSQNSQVQR